MYHLALFAKAIDQTNCSRYSAFHLKVSGIVFAQTARNDYTHRYFA